MHDREVYAYIQYKKELKCMYITYIYISFVYIYASSMVYIFHLIHKKPQALIQFIYLYRNLFSLMKECLYWPHKGLEIVKYYVVGIFHFGIKLHCFDILAQQ